MTQARVARSRARGAERSRAGSTTRRFARSLAWAFGGAIVFAIPTLMTMEMWYLGFYIAPWKLAQFTVLALLLFFGLSYYLGFEETSVAGVDVLDSFIAYAIGFVTAAVALGLIGAIGPGMSAGEIVGKVAIQVFPCGLGALLARDQLSGGRARVDEREAERRRSGSYLGQIFLMAVGAIFLSFNVAPTEEMILIAYRLSGLQALFLLVFTLALMHAFVWSSPLRQETFSSRHGHGWEAFAIFTVVGYAVSLLISAYMLWLFGRFDGLALAEAVKAVVVLGFPAAIGAAASRLIL